jgi:hypothetical protein
MISPKRSVVLVSSPKTSLDLDFSKNCNIDGANWARSTIGTEVDFEGLVKTAKINEARFTGARRVENLLPTSTPKAAGTSGWAIHVATSYTITTGISDPFGGTSAVSVLINGGGLTSGLLNNMSSQGVIPSTSVSTCWLRVASGTRTVKLYGNGSSAADVATITVDTTWRRYSSKYATNNAGNARYFILADIGDGNSIEIYGCHYGLTTGQANLNPSEYVSTGILAYPYHGAGVDGVKYFATTNGNTVTNNVVTEAAGTPLTGITLLAEEARTNLLLNSATPATQNITTTAQIYTISMWGTGTCTLTGTATGTLTGTGATTRVSLTVTATAGTLTLTFAGTNTNGQAEAGNSMSSYIVTAGTAVTRTADIPSFTGIGLSWYNPQQGTFVVKASGSSFNAPYNLGALNQTYSTPTNYSIDYNNNTKSGSTYLSTKSTIYNPTEFTSISTPTTLYLSSGGIANISRFSYYPKKLKTNKLANLL